MVAVERPSMEPEARLAIREVLDVEENLFLCLLDVVRPVEDLADFGEREDRHHESVVPELTVVV